MNERVLKMPRLGETMEEGKVVGWLIKVGDSFKRGDSILEIETDKTIAEFPALGDGRLYEILVSIGDTVEVGMPLARIDIGAGPDWTAEEGEEALPAVEAAVAAANAAPSEGRVETDLAMPRLGETMEEGRIARWLKAPGDAFVRGEAIIEIETDKTIAEFPALTDGRLVAILQPDDVMVVVGEPIARIEIAAGAAFKSNTEVVEAHKIPEHPQTPNAPARQKAGGRTRATPLARRLARRAGLEVSQLVGSGRRGRVEKQDVFAATGGATSAKAAAPVDVRFASLPRGRMAYTDSGAGTGLPVLLLHGFSGDRTTWASVVAGLKRAGRRAIAPDLPAHGLTDIDADSERDLFADVVPLLDALGVVEVDVVAHSLGSVTAVALASSAPGRVASLSLIAPAGLGSEIDGHFINGMANATAPGETAHLLRGLSVNRMNFSDAALGVLAAGLAKGRLVALAESIAGPSGQKVDILPALERLSAAMPVRVLFGTEDRIIPWKHVAALPPRVAIHILSRSGHMPQWDQTRDVLDIILS